MYICFAIPNDKFNTRHCTLNDEDNKLHPVHCPMTNNGICIVHSYMYLCTLNFNTNI